MLEPTLTLYLIIVVFCLISIAPLVFVATRLKSSYKSSTVALPPQAAMQPAVDCLHAREAAQRVRLIVSSTLLATGWTCIILGLFPGALQSLRMWPGVQHCGTCRHPVQRCDAGTVWQPTVGPLMVGPYVALPWPDPHAALAASDGRATHANCRSGRPRCSSF